MLLENYRPQPKLVTKTTIVTTPRFPVIDAHNHLQGHYGDWDKKPLHQLLDRLEEVGVDKYVDLDGGWGEEIFFRHMDYFKSKYPEKFYIFGGVDWNEWVNRGDDFPDWAAGRIRTQKEAGAQGIKIWKPFGLQVKDHHGRLVKVDDPRLAPIWETAAELHLPVMIHLADPVAFFDPVDETNERWEELAQHPDWVFTSPPYPPFLDILFGLRNLVLRQPNTIFIGAHVGCYAENLDFVGNMLGDCPNYYIDISGRISELGRQPYSAKKFFQKYQDRILFGLDMGPDPDAYRIYYRFLETDDEYFNYDTSEIPDAGRWRIYGLNLPDEILRKIYYKNAIRILEPG
jgi:predicted TIM-barrel fold metal-dependent hydrolase